MHSIVNALYDCCDIARTITLEYCNWHNQCSGIGPYNTDTIVGSSSNTSHMGTVLVIVTHLCGIIDEVVTMFVGRTFLGPNIIL